MNSEILKRHFQSALLSCKTNITLGVSSVFIATFTFSAWFFFSALNILGGFDFWFRFAFVLHTIGFAMAVASLKMQEPNQYVAVVGLMINLVCWFFVGLIFLD